MSLVQHQDPKPMDNSAQVAMEEQDKLFAEVTAAAHPIINTPYGQPEPKKRKKR